MVQSASTSEAEFTSVNPDADLTPAQLSAMAGGYVHSEAPSAPSDGKVDKDVALKVLESRPEVAARFFRMLSAGAGAAALAFLLAACGPTGEPTTPTSPTAASDTPTPSPTETESPAVKNPFVGELAITPDQISEYTGLSIDELRALDPHERTGYFLSLANDPKTGLQAYSDLYVYVTKNDADALPAVISVNNTPDEIVLIAAYGQRYSFQFDTAKGQKLLAGAMNDLDSGYYTDVDKKLQENAPVSVNLMAAWGSDGSGRGIDAGTVVSFGEKIQATPTSDTYIVIVVQRADGKKVSIPYTFVTNGTMGMWEPGAATEVQ